MQHRILKFGIGCAWNSSDGNKLKNFLSKLKFGIGYSWNSSDATKLNRERI